MSTRVRRDPRGVVAIGQFASVVAWRVEKTEGYNYPNEKLPVLQEKS